VVHVCITGPTASGKTTLARLFAARAKAEKRGVLYRSSIYDSSFPCDEFVKDAEKLWELRKTHKNCDVFIDEAADYDCFGGRGKNTNILRQGRHYGWRCHVLTQRVKGVNQDVLRNCTDYYIFKTSREEIEVLKQVVDAEPAVLAEAQRLPRGKCLALRPWQEPVILNVFDSSQ
jgi:energy-coupling factor transporter ATP-binding protein EcfA2